MSELSNIAKKFLIDNGFKPRYINKNGYKCLSILTQEDALYIAQKIINMLTSPTATITLDVFRAFLYFKYEGFGLDSVIYWPSIDWEEE